MQAIDLSRLLSDSGVKSILPAGTRRIDGLYHAEDGTQFRSQDAHNDLIQETVRLSDSAMLFASDFSPEGERIHHQAIRESDWIHIQFRLSGGGRESISLGGDAETPEMSCVISRYPKDSTITRVSTRTERWKVACLLVTPKGLTELLDISARGLPDCAAWLAQDDELEFRTGVVPLQSAMAVAVNDILSCQFRGEVRRAYMRAKSLELLSTSIHTLVREGAKTTRPTVKLSAADFDCLAQALAIMNRDLEASLTLADLARRVGLNRTKLALGFKEVYGVSVQAYWRDAKLNRAREILRDGRTRVTEVALSLGYSELSSFTRAFSRKFGILPRDCKS